VERAEIFEFLEELPTRSFRNRRWRGLKALLVLILDQILKVVAVGVPVDDLRCHGLLSLELIAFRENLNVDLVQRLLVKCRKSKARFGCTTIVSRLPCCSALLISTTT
jgi:hypothetical protein